jgi:uncharacterized protein
VTGVRAFVVTLLFCLTPVPVLLAQEPLPAAYGFVNDLANVLPASVRERLDARLREAERETTAEVVVVTLPSLNGATVEDYAVRLFNTWGIGKKGKDNGVLILVAPADRAMRIEVGYGLEPVLPDGLAGEIVRTAFLPAFRDGDYPRGIEQGIERVLGVVRRNEVASSSSAPDGGGEDIPWFVVPFLGLFVGIGSFVMGLGLRTKVIFLVLWASIFTGVPMLMVTFGFGWPVRIGMVAFGAALLMWGYRRGRADGAQRVAGAALSPSRRSGWTWGSSGSSSGRSSGGGSSSSGSFGGGRSGGGGASGRW